MGKPKNILVIGEAILDEFVLCKVERFDPSGPFPVLLPQKTIQNSGGAGNTVANLFSLKGNYDLNVHFLRPPETIVKTRYVCEKTNHKFCRIDRFDKISQENRLSSKRQLTDFCESQEIKFVDFDCVVFSDYGKGFITKEFVKLVSQKAQTNNIPVFLDTKFDLGDWSQDIFCVKINEKEYLNSDKLSPIPERYCQNLIVTYGKDGARWKKYEGFDLGFSLEKEVEVSELCGLGDIFLSALVINYLETNNLESGIKWANKVCSYKSTKKGIFAVNRKDIENNKI